jgi:hypothetical protein
VNSNERPLGRAVTADCTGARAKLYHRELRQQVEWSSFESRLGREPIIEKINALGKLFCAIGSMDSN